MDEVQIKKTAEDLDKLLLRYAAVDQDVTLQPALGHILQVTASKAYRLPSEPRVRALQINNGADSIEQQAAVLARSQGRLGKMLGK
jgi:hypothetical protein